jgi:hypothetical protein
MKQRWCWSWKELKYKTGNGEIIHYPSAMSSILILVFWGRVVVLNFLLDMKNKANK